MTVAGSALPGRPNTGASVPDAVDDLSGSAGDTQVTLTWSAPDNNGAAISDYDYRVDGGTWTSTGSTSTTFTVTSLTNDTEYDFEIRAVNSAGDGAASNLVSVTPVEGQDDYPAPSTHDQRDLAWWLTVDEETLRSGGCEIDSAGMTHVTLPHRPDSSPYYISSSTSVRTIPSSRALHAEGGHRGPVAGTLVEGLLEFLSATNKNAEPVFHTAHDVVVSGFRFKNLTLNILGSSGTEFICYRTHHTWPFTEYSRLAASVDRFPPSSIRRVGYFQRFENGAWRTNEFVWERPTPTGKWYDDDTGVAFGVHARRYWGVDVDDAASIGSSASMSSSGVVELLGCLVENITDHNVGLGKGYYRPAEWTGTDPGWWAAYKAKWPRLAIVPPGATPRVWNNSVGSSNWSAGVRQNETADTWVLSPVLAAWDAVGSPKYGQFPGHDAGDIAHPDAFFGFQNGRNYISYTKFDNSGVDSSISVKASYIEVKTPISPAGQTWDDYEWEADNTVWTGFDSGLVFNFDNKGSNGTVTIIFGADVYTDVTSAGARYGFDGGGYEDVAVGSRTDGPDRTYTVTDPGGSLSQILALTAPAGAAADPHLTWRSANPDTLATLLTLLGERVDGGNAREIVDVLGDGDFF